MSTRAGIGYDSHRFATPGPLVLGGIRIDFDRHLAGHSDGDAIAHALIDAILGAAGAGDIGEMFPDRDPRNAGRSSIEMLTVVGNRVRGDGWRLDHADLTVITEVPRLAPHRHAMKTALAQALRVPTDAISIKGKTNEGMGFIGREEGLACIAVATLARDG